MHRLYLSHKEKCLTCDQVIHNEPIHVRSLYVNIVQFVHPLFFCDVLWLFSITHHWGAEKVTSDPLVSQQNVSKTDTARSQFVPTRSETLQPCTDRY